MTFTFFKNDFFSISKKKCHWDIDRNCIESIVWIVCTSALFNWDIAGIKYVSCIQHNDSRFLKVILYFYVLNFGYILCIVKYIFVAYSYFICSILYLLIHYPIFPLLPSLFLLVTTSLSYESFSFCYFH